MIQYQPDSSIPKTSAGPDRTLAIIASTMRSGSTLLKSLLQEAPDIARLGEVNFQKYAGKKNAADKMWKLAAEPILLLKRPAWYHEGRRYPQLPEVDQLRVIALVRDCRDTLLSLRRMTFGPFANSLGKLCDHWLALRYWLPATERLVGLALERPVEVRLIRYEDLVQNPLTVTAGLFRFLGSCQREGVDSYSPPRGYRWRWGSDDNSPRLRSLKVQPPRRAERPADPFSLWIDQQPGLQLIRQKLGYDSCWPESE